MGFLRTVFIIIIVIYGLRMLSRLLAPWMLKKAQSKMQKMAEEQMRQQGFDPQGRSQRPEGSVTVENISPKKKKSPSSKSDDDYIDFEEVK